MGIMQGECFGGQSCSLGRGRVWQDLRKENLFIYFGMFLLILFILGCFYLFYLYIYIGNFLGIRYCCGNQVCSGYSQRYCCSEDSVGSVLLWRAQVVGLWGFILLLYWQDQYRFFLGFFFCYDLFIVVYLYINV